MLAAAAPPKKRPNMPVGWTWPPSPAMKAADAQCLARLDAAGVEYAKGKPVKKVSTPLVIPGLVLGDVVLTPLKGKGAYPMDCQLAAAIVEVAPDLAALGVRALRFRTLHEYRNVRKNGRTTKILSRHAIGLAIDVFGFELTDGTLLEVERDWASEPKLAAIVDVIAASSRFRTPLSPANDPKNHDDHVHLEAHLVLVAPSGALPGAGNRAR
jgi:hypothetical protein